MDTTEALNYATQKHADQARRDGSPYIMHPMAIACSLKEKGYEEKYIVTALFHDLLEDTDATEEEILELSDPDVLEAVKLLTKTPENKESYIDAILDNPIAKVVKNEDRIHNLQCAVTADPAFVTGYLTNTEQYLGKFSKELDKAYQKLKDLNNNCEYTTDASVDDYVLYRTFEDKAWEMNFSIRTWEECDPYFWTELDDNAKSISKTEAEQMIRSYNEGR